MEYKDQLVRKSMNDPDDINEFSPRYKEGECVQPALVKICLERLIQGKNLYSENQAQALELLFASFVEVASICSE